ncbi:MAG: SRPBCC family protein [Gammaproteobacteria bacterium]
MAIHLEFTLPATADAVWAIVGDPGRTDWVPGVASCTFDGTVRRFVMTGAGTLAERILLRDHAARRLEYSVIESAAPLRAHHAAITVLPLVNTDTGAEAQSATGSTAPAAQLIWETTVEPVAVEPFIREQMRAAIVALTDLLTRNS